MHQALTRQATPAPNWRPLAWCAGAAALLLCAAWFVPPMLDWGRLRTVIASIASARLGRPVVIGGEITLRLLPDAVLTASDVTLADPGDGVSVQVAALRLQVATWPLAAGRVVVRDLVLSAPVLHLPWSLPRGIGQSARPQVPHPFAARVENGTLRIGEAEVTGIGATFHGGPAAGGAETAGPDGTLVSAFGAEGFAASGGRNWRFTAALGAPDADGVSAVDIAVRGQGAVGDTGGSLQGTLADGVVQGRLRAGGTDLSLLMPAPAGSWTAEAPFVADATRIEANAISLSLGGAPADGALVLHIDAPARLEGHLHAASLDLDGWAALLGRSLGAAPVHGAAIRLQVGLSADSARLLDGTLGGVQATLVSDGGSFGFDRAEAVLPGAARLAAAQIRFARGADGQLAASGAASLAAPDLHATLAWLRPLAPGLAGAVPQGVLRQADLTGVLSLQAGRGSVTGLAGRVDGAPVAGDAAIRLDGRPALSATLALGELPLDAWLGDVASAGSLAGFATRFTHAATILRLTAAHATLFGQTLEGLDLAARTGAGGLVIERAQAGLDGASLRLAGRLAADGTLAGLRLSANAASLEGVLTRLPPAVRWMPAFWQGAGDVQATADGPADAVAIQLRADARDLVLEADSVRNTRAGTGVTTLTLRHPGAPRLLAALGLPQALGLPPGLAATAQWLDTGALTLRAHFQDGPARLRVQDFDLDAAALRLSGRLDVDASGRLPAVSGSLAFEQLALPGVLPDLRHVSVPGGWTARLHVAAATVSAGLRPVASNASLDLAAEGGRMAWRNLSADVAGGRLTGQADADLTLERLTLASELAGATVANKLTGWPIDLAAGTADLNLALELDAAGWAGLSGSAHLRLRDATVTGFDLAQLAAAAPLHTKAGRTALQMALTQGASPGLAGAADAAIAGGVLTLSAATLESADGLAEFSGGADLGWGSVDARVRLTPSPPGSPGFAVRLSGPWAGPSALPGSLVGRKQGHGSALDPLGPRTPDPVRRGRG